MLVATTHLRPMAPFGLFGGAVSKIRCCCCGGRVEYKGIHFKSPISVPWLSTSFFILLQASSISCQNNQILILIVKVCHFLLMMSKLHVHV